MNEIAGAISGLVPEGARATFGAINTCAGGTKGFSLLGISVGKTNPCTIHAGTYYDSHDTTNNNQDQSVNAFNTGGAGDNGIQISNTGNGAFIEVTDGGARREAFAYTEAANIRTHETIRQTNALADARVNVAQRGVFAAQQRNNQLLRDLSGDHTNIVEGAQNLIGATGRNQTTQTNSTLAAFFKSQTAESTQLLDSVIKFGFPIAVAGVLGYFYLKG